MSKLATMVRTHTCGELRAEHVPAPAEDGSAAPEPLKVKLAGHVDTLVDDDTLVLRDRYGKTLIRVDEEALPYVGDRIRKRGIEDVIQVVGTLAIRDDDQKDAALPTGEVVVRATEVEVLSEASGVFEEILGGERPGYEDRLTFRQLYLRRPEVQERMAQRARITHEAREYLLSQSFLEIETPQLFLFDPVAIGAETVPVNANEAFSLSGGPAVLNQYVKPGQFERYFQFTTVTTREDEPTPLHAQEYTALDINMCYADVPDFFKVVEGMLGHLWQSVLGKKLKAPFHSFSYAESLLRFGTDKPDLRFGCEIQELEGAVPGKTVRAFVIPAKRSKGKDGMVGGVLARIFEPPPEPEPEPPSEDDPDMAAAFEVIPEPELDTPADAGDADPGPPPVEEAELSWARVGRGGASKGSAAAIAKQPALLKALGAKPGDAVVVSVAEDAHSAAIGAGLARTELGTRLGLIDETRTEPVWVHSYPLFFMREGQWEPFVVVFAAFNSDDDFEVMHNQPDKKHLIKTKAFDLVINGLELASAYVGNSSLAMQRIIWETLFGMQKGDLSRMRAPIEAYRFGMPPHGEVNLGFERLLALMLGVDSLDEVIAYPKTQQCRDLMLDAPGPVPPEAIPELLDHEEGEAAGATDDEQEYDPDAEDSAQEAAA